MASFLSYLKSTISQTYWLLEELDEEVVEETLEDLDLGMYVPMVREETYE